MKSAITFFVLLTIILQSTFEVLGQVCPNDPPVNTFLADSPWPIYHRNNYAQSSTCFKGPLQGDSLKTVFKGEIVGGTSAWIYPTEYYANGERALLYSNATHVFKLVDEGDEIVTADSLRIDFDPLQSFGWNFLLAKNKTWFTYDPKYNPQNDQFTKLYKLSDEDTTDVYSKIIVLDTFDFGEFGVNRVQHFSLNYSGQIVFNSDNNTEERYGTIGIISQEFELLDTLRFSTDTDEITNHNAFPIDENNSFYITTNKRLIKFDWDGSELSMAWQADYNFVGDGPTGTFAEGSGTTPTLMGWGSGNDQLVIMSDGHSKNNLVAFWRELPPDWQGVSGMDIRFADSIQLPAAESFSNTFQSIENSPTVFGYEIAIAQFNGFLGYDCNNFKGVQKLHWDTDLNQFEIDWVNTDINMNGVLTFSKDANTVYCSGKEDDCNYYYYGIDWTTGGVNLRYLLGEEGTFLNDPFYDSGVNNIVMENGDIYFSGGASVVKVGLVERLVNSTHHNIQDRISLFPNPTNGIVRIESEFNLHGLSLVNLDGNVMKTWIANPEVIDLSSMPNGMYFMKIDSKFGTFFKRILKVN